MRRLAAGLVALVALVGVPAPDASADDGQFLSAVSAIGINADPARLIAAAHAECDAMPFPNNFASWGNQARWMGAGVPMSLVTQVFIAAGRAYCPDKLHAIGLS
jgi:Protein of unknown function (DUF732)